MPITEILYQKRKSSFTAYLKYSKGACFMDEKAFYGRFSSKAQAGRSTIKVQRYLGEYARRS